MSRTPWELPGDDAFEFRANRRTRWSDEDTQGVLNNAVFPTLFEEARLDWCRRLGLLDGQHFPFVLAETRLRFLRPGRGGVPVAIELATTRLGRSSFEQAYRVRDSSTGELWCEGTAVLVFWDPSTRAAAPIPASARAAIEAALEGSIPSS